MAACWGPRWLIQGRGCAMARSLSSQPNLAGFCRDFSEIRDNALNSGSYPHPAPRVHHITNVREDGTIPKDQKPSWQTLNTFRTNAQIEGGTVCNPIPPG